MSRQYISTIKKWISLQGLHALTQIILTFQFGIIIFSILYPNSAYFFFSLKALIVFSIFLWMIEQSKPTKWFIYGLLIILPGIWATISGIFYLNPGVRYEIPVYLLAPISYLIIFRYSGAPFFKLILPALKIICALNLSVFYFLYFSKDGELYSLLEAATKFFIQYPEGYEKVNTLQATPLIYLLPVLLVHFHFKRNAINFLLVSGCLLMALLLSRKAILLLLAVLYIGLFLHSLYCRHKPKHVIFLFSPILVALTVFSQISNVNYSKYVDETVNSFPSITVFSQISNVNYSKYVDETVNSFPSMETLAYADAGNICSREFADRQSNYSPKVGAVIRGNQIQVLKQQIELAPWFGHGLGYVVPQCIRSEQQPWRFEMTYLGMIMNIGIIGVLLFCIVYFRWMVCAIRSGIVQDSIRFPLLIGSLFFLICSATNPYVMAVEYLWVFFIPYLIVQAKNGEITERCSSRKTGLLHS